jgi:hypothetical protein
MKALIISSIALAVALSVRPASGQSFTFDENGRGVEITTSGGTTPIPVTLSKPPVYHLGYLSIPGDILIIEPGTPNNAPSDMLRFDAQGNVTVFSDVEPNDVVELADVTALPPPVSPFTTVTENGPNGGPGVEGGVNGLFGYTPPVGSPGASPAGAVPVTLNFISDVPEPSSWGLLILALGLGLLMRRRRPIA